MSSISIQFPSGGPGPVESGKLKYCSGDYSADGTPTTIEVFAKIYQPGQTPSTNKPGDASPADVDLINSTWSFPGGLGGADATTPQQTVRAWLVLDNVTDCHDDATFDPCVESPSDCPSPGEVAWGGALEEVVSIPPVIDTVALKSYCVQLDLRSIALGEPARSLLSGGVLQARPTVLTYEPRVSHWRAEVWASSTGRLRLTVMRSKCGKSLQADISMVRISTRGVRSPVRWYCPDFSLLKGGRFAGSARSSRRQGVLVVKPGG